MSKKKLSVEQGVFSDAVVAGADGVYVLLAGAGSGKTHTVVETIARQIEKKKEELLGWEDLEKYISGLCVVTYTTAAAGELRHRIGVRLGELEWGQEVVGKIGNIEGGLGVLIGQKIRIGTYHSLALEILRGDEYKDVRYLGGVIRHGFGIEDEEVMRRAFKEVARSVLLGGGEFARGEQEWDRLKEFVFGTNSGTKASELDILAYMTIASGQLPEGYARAKDIGGWGVLSENEGLRGVQMRKRRKDALRVIRMMWDRIETKKTASEDDKKCELYQVVEAIYEGVAARRHRGQKVSFGELLDIFEQEVNNSTVPKFHTVFVDEAQDCNRKKMDLSLQLGAKVVFVGDMAQAIYRFQDAEPTCFAEINAKESTHSFTLKDNYRSASKIVKLNNCLSASANKQIVFSHEKNNEIIRNSQPLFGCCYSAEIGLPTYIIQNCKLSAHGATTVTLFRDYWQEIEETANAALSEAAAGNRVAIIAVQNNPYLKDMRETLEHIKRERGLSASIALYSEQEDSVVSLWAIAENLHNGFAGSEKKVGGVAAKLRKIPSHYFLSDEDFARHKTKSPERKSYSVEQIYRSYGTAKFIAAAIRASRRACSDGILRTPIIDIGSPDPNASTLFLSEEEWAASENIGQQMFGKKNATGFNVSSWLADGLSAIKEISSQISAAKLKTKESDILLTTAHSSKGLEFHSVFAVGCSDKFYSSTQDGDISPYENPVADSAEKCRLLYVTMTRAIKNLHISAPFLSHDLAFNNFSPFLTHAGIAPNSHNPQSQKHSFLLAGEILTERILHPPITFSAQTAADYNRKLDKKKRLFFGLSKAPLSAPKDLRPPSFLPPCQENNYRPSVSVSLYADGKNKNPQQIVFPSPIHSQNVTFAKQGLFLRSIVNLFGFHRSK